MSVKCLYREGDCWSVMELNAFSVQCAADSIGFDPDAAVGEESIGAVQTGAGTDMTIITYFNSDGESRNWIAPTALFVD